MPKILLGDESHRKKKEKVKRKEKSRQKTIVQTVKQQLPTDVDVSGIPPWAWSTLADADLFNCSPVFTKDSKYFFVASSSSVKIYSIATGKVVSTLSIDNGSNNLSQSTITALCLNPQNRFQLYTASSQGHICLWDFMDAVLLRTVTTGLSILRMCAHPSNSDEVFVCSSKTSSEKEVFVVYRISLHLSKKQKKGEIVIPNAKIGVIRSSAPPSGLVISPLGHWLVVTAGSRTYVAKTSDLSAGFAVFFSSADELTCLTFHPSEEIFATGDAIGVVRLWYCLDSTRIAWNSSSEERKAPTTTLHWHAHAVSSLTFTPNGAYLLSGGEEAVLVVWQFQSGHREFIPRLGAPIQSITVLPSSLDREQQYLVGLVDGSILLIESSSLKIIQSFPSLKLKPEGPSSPSDAAISAPLAIHPSTSYLILPSSHPSSLQIYSTQTSELISELEVSPSNRVSRRDEAPIEPARISHAVVSPGFSTRDSSRGEWMATVDVRDGGDDFGDEVVMKIWRWENGTFALNTRIDRPHGKGTITSVSFNPASDSHLSCILVTTGEDGLVRTWRVASSIDKSGEEEVFWAPRSTFGYRSQIPTKAAWSPDGSILAVAQGPYITLWDPIVNTLLNALICPEISKVNDISLIGNSGRYVVAVGPEGVVLWDLLVGAPRWHHLDSTFQAQVLVHPTRDQFVLVRPVESKDSKSPISHLAIFHANSPRPVRTHTLPFSLRHAIWFGSPRSSKFSFVGITSQWSAMLLGDEVQRPTTDESVGHEISNLPSLERPTLFQDLFGRSALVDLTQRDDIRVAENNVASTSTAAPTVSKEGIDLRILDGPSHLLPPLESLFSSLMIGFIQPSGSSGDTGASNGGDDPAPRDQAEVEDVEMEDAIEDSAPTSERFVDEREMKVFTKLFRSQLSKGSPVPKRKEKLSNGVIVNGNGNSNGIHVNGVHRDHAVPTPLKAVSTPQGKLVNGSARKMTNGASSSQTPQKEVAESPTTGQKRKKSSAG